MKPIRLTHHAREQCLERGVSEDEVKQAVINGSRETTKSDRILIPIEIFLWTIMAWKEIRESDALYIRLIEGKHEYCTVRLNEEIALNIGPDEKLVGNRRH
jgi:hypothetical protein